MKNKRFLRTLTTLLCVLALCLPTFSFAEAAEAQDVVEVISTYTKLDLEPYRGKAIFLNFFTGWCPYCMQEMPDIRKMYDAYDPEQLEVILVHVWDGEDADDTAKVVKQHGLDGMNIFEDEDLGLSKFVGLPGYPGSMLINKDGTLLGTISRAGSYEQLAELVEMMDVSAKVVEP